MKTFPTLFKRTSTGAIQQWTIIVLDQRGSTTAAIIKTEFGQVNSRIQSTEDLIQEGKNHGKSNQTTPAQQAESEAQAKYDKQLKKGYVTSIAAAEAGEIDAVIEGGINPMLAHKHADHGHKIPHPAYLQPKLDGIRIIAILKNGKCTLWSRTRKPIHSLPHIVKSIESLGPDLDVILDGEAYNHNFKNNFEHIVSLVRQDSPDPRHEDVEYHVYDIVNDKPFSTRAQMIQSMPKLPHIVKVESVVVQDENEVGQWFSQWLSEGYEGAMIRSANGKYENKRSYGLQKIKTFEDSEFEIIGVEEGRGKLAGHVGAFVCLADNGVEFKAKMSGDTGLLKKYFEDHSLWEDKWLTVKYQGLSSTNNVPRFPVGIRIREEE